MGIAQEIASIFDAVADLVPERRGAYYEEHGIAPEVWEQVEALLEFDAESEVALDEVVAAGASSAAAVLDSMSYTERCGAFQPVTLLGQGGAGTVWLAERVDGEVEQVVAVKLLQGHVQFPRVQERFIQERRILASLSHPNIARLLDAGRSAHGQPYLAMEYVEGQSIDAYCAPLAIEDRLRVFLKVCEAVSYAHAMLVVHRDLKPSNIMVTPAGEPKLLDFGIAKLITPDAERTETIGRVLSPDYASPEQVKGEDTGTASDVYSLGAILYRLLAGRSPHQFDEMSAAAVYQVICEREVRRPSDWNRALAGDLDCILLKALRKEPHERYASVEKLAEDIEAFLDHRPVAARSGNMLYRGRRFLRRQWFWVMAPALAIAGLTVGLVMAQQQRRMAENARNVAEAQRVEAQRARDAAAVERDHAARDRAAAVSETEVARREREEADLQRTVAERRFREQRQLALHLLDLDKEIMRVDGATKARQSLVSTGLQYLEKLRAESGTSDPEFRMELADAYKKVADVQAGSGHPNLGQVKEALANLEKAEKMLLAGGKDRRTLLKLADNLDLQTRIAANGQEWTSADQRMVRGAQYMKALRAVSAGMNAEDHLAMLLSEASLEYTAQAIDVNLERTKQAVYHGGRSAAVRGEIYRLTGKQSDEANYAAAMLALATTLRYDGSMEPAAEQATAGRKILQRQYDSSNGDSISARKLEWAYYNEARLIGSLTTISLERFADAEHLLEQGIVIARKLVDLDRDDISSRSILAYTAYELGLLRLERDPAGALEYFDEGYRRRDEIPSNLPAHLEKYDLLAASVRALARLGRYDEAQQRLDRLFPALREAKKFPGPQRPSDYGSNALIAQADLAVATGRLEDAVRIWKGLVTSYEADKERVAADDLHWATYHSAAFRTLAKLVAKQGKTDEERAWLDRDRALWEHWNRKLPRNTYVMAQLTK